MRVRLPLLFSLLLCAVHAQAAQRVDLDYHVRLVPQADQAEVRLTLEKGEVIRSLDFNLGEEGTYSDFQADGQWSQEQPGRGVWKPAAGKAQLSYRVRISHARGDGRFDARMTEDWALFRGDDLVPPVHLDEVDGTVLVARLQFELPSGNSTPALLRRRWWWRTT